MKHFKKLASVALALVLALAMAVPAFAAEAETTGTETTGTITIDNPISGQTYTAHKIFDVKYEGENYSYTIDENNLWYKVVNAYATKTSGLTLTATAVPGLYNVTTTDVFSAAAFAAYLKNQKVNDEGLSLTSDANGDVSVADLPLGYYFVKSSSGALCNLTTTNPKVVIHDKNEEAPFEKTDNKDDVEIGETVNYTIKGKVPSTEGYTSYVYKVSDTMSAGLTFNPDTLKVKIGGQSLTRDVDYTVTFKDPKDPNGQTENFILDIAMLDGDGNAKYTFDADIEITYSAVVNENAIATVEKNNAKLEYSNNPSNSTDKGTKTDEEYVYSAQIKINKTDDKNQALAGAKFVLRREAADSTLEKPVYEYYQYTEAKDGNPAKVKWVSDQKDATPKVTDKDGYAAFVGLKKGEYELVEIEAPDGYNLLDKPVEVEVTAATVLEDGSQGTPVIVQTTDEDGNVTGETLMAGVTVAEQNTTVLTSEADVVNNAGTLLPSTGGIGTTIFYIAGGVLLVGAVVLLIAKRRTSGVDDE